mmetsp:Transcript_96823/g.152573  ORF Transcript_96823/g.152573 Transcript_96823/m.152573 type:complete len:607 (-) Transcript_96823:85-1905(-)
MTGCSRDSHDSLARVAIETLPLLVLESEAALVANVLKEVILTRVAPLRVVALDALAKLRRGGESLARDFLIEHVRIEQDSDVRAAALTALTSVAMEKDDQVIDLLCSSLEDHSSSVRRASYSLIPEVVQRGHHLTGISLVKGFKDENTDVRKSAVASFAAIAEKSDTVLMNTAGKVLECANRDFRSAALMALEAVSVDSDLALAEVCKRLNHKSKHVRRHMLEAVARLNGASHPLVIAACVEALQDSSHEDVRFDALRALDSLFPKGNKLTLEHVARTASEDYVTRNQCFALQLLCKMGKGRRVAMLVAASALGERDADVVQQGFKTLIEVSPPGSNYALECLVELLPLRHLQLQERVDRRLYIIDAMMQIGSGTKHEASIQALTERIEDLNPSVRSIALEALQSIAGVGNARAVEAVANLLLSRDADMRALAVSRLQLFAAPFDPIAARAAIKHTASEHFETRVAALHALAGIINPSRIMSLDFKLGLEYASERLHLSRASSSLEWPQTEVLSRLEALASYDEYQPVKAAASTILTYLHKWEPIPSDGLGSVVYAPLGDATRFNQSGALSALENAQVFEEPVKFAEKRWTLQQFRRGGSQLQQWS